MQPFTMFPKQLYKKILFILLYSILLTIYFVNRSINLSNSNFYPFIKPPTNLTKSTFYFYINSPTNLSNETFVYFQPCTGIQCFHSTSATLPDISDFDPEENSSIFFHETSCNSYCNGKIVVTARQACAVESAARLNPDKVVYLLYASPGDLKFEGDESDRFLHALIGYKNVRILHVDYGRYTRDTPVEELYKKRKLDASRYAIAHASDVFRYLTLWKYGGIYLDLDVIVTKPLTSLALNFAGAESEINVADGVLSFSASGEGHDLAFQCLRDLKDNFRGWEWSYNGPGVITRLLKRLCGAEQAKHLVGKKCRGFKVHPPEMFYAINYGNWTNFFEEQWTEKVLTMTEKSFAVHVWNKLSGDKRVPVKKEVGYVLLAQKFCPKVFKECDEFF